MTKRMLFPVLTLALLLSMPAHAAKNSKRLSYPLSDIWSTAVRLLRADLGYRVKEKDRDNGLILFAMPGKAKGKVHGGSMEFVRFVDDQGFKMVRVQLTIAGMPSYIEVQILEKLERKLREEQGRAPEPEKAKKKKKPSDKEKGDEEKKDK